MADAELQALDAPAPWLSQQSVQQSQQILNLNWSHSKPEFAGKPEEDVEAHLLIMKDWMNTHQFWEGIKA